MTIEQFSLLWQCFAQRVRQNQEHLDDLDRAIGDGDHGTNLTRGLGKVEILGNEPPDPHLNLQTLSKKVGMTLLSTVGGASGALWGSGLMKAALVFPMSSECDDRTLVLWMDTFVGNIEERGKAHVGDKTMVDVMRPAVNWLQAAPQDRPLRARLRELRELAQHYAQGTKDLQARRGRASYLGARSIGHVDPGAFSSALWWECLDSVLGG